ncbi:MAG TPA: DUF1684 domain-containing protein [Gemmatimonadales bacterium]|nr:DUF1684 domain-containing protein [Gemmatimonadales bacterium]
MISTRFQAAGVALVSLAGSLAAQSTPPDVARERAAYTEWLATAPNSPFAAVAQQPIGPAVRLGPADADVPLEGVAEHRVRERGGVVTLEGPEGSRPLPLGRPVALGSYFVTAGGVAGRRVLTVYGPIRAENQAEYYPYDSGLVFTGPLSPPKQPGRLRVLALDGVETEAAEAGTVTVPIGRRPVRLKVRRIPTGMEDESELEIYFRDDTNGRGTYPAGRFVALVPLPDGRYRLDFNRARNPFCAYSSAFPCPAPWRGNTIEAKVEAGERYLGGGLSAPPADLEAR